MGQRGGRGGSLHQVQIPDSHQECRDVERWPSRKHSSETQMHLLEEDSEMEGSRASLLEWGEGGGMRVENSKGEMGMIAP